MGWIYWAIFGAAIIHVIEEYFFPGGFMRIMKDFQPKYAALVTVPFAVIINGLFVVLCLAAALNHGRSPLFGLSVAALVGINGLMHIGAAVRLRGYAPGVLSGVILYLPLGILAFSKVSARGGLSLGRALTACAFALVLQAVPIVYLGLSRLINRNQK